MLEKLWPGWVREREVIRDAPVSFALAVVLCAAAVGSAEWWAVSYHFSGIIEAKDATIAALKSGATGTAMSGPRLTEAQKRYVAGVLAHLPPRSVDVVMPMELHEGPEYADDFVELFKSVGWEARRVQRYFDRTRFGLLLRCKRDDAAAGTFGNALLDVGIKLLPYEPTGGEPSWPADHWELIVGAKIGG